MLNAIRLRRIGLPCVGFAAATRGNSLYVVRLRVFHHRTFPFPGSCARQGQQQPSLDQSPEVS